MLFAQRCRGADALDLDPQTEQQSLLAGVLADRRNVIRKPRARVPVPGILPPAVRLRPEPSGVDQKLLGANVSGEVDLAFQAGLVFVVHDVTAMIGFHLILSAGYRRRQHVAPDVFVQGLNYVVQIGIHQEQVGLARFHGFAGLKDAENGIGRGRTQPE